MRIMRSSLFRVSKSDLTMPNTSNLVLLLIVGVGFVFFTPSASQSMPGTKLDCKLNSSSPFAEVVLIWDFNKDATSRSDGRPGTASMGTMITCMAALTAAYYYNTKVFNDMNTFRRLNQFQRFRVISQNVWDSRTGQGRLNPCYQNRTVTKIYTHPKANTLGERILFDFAVVVIPGPFNVSSPTFPTMFFPTTTSELVLTVRWVNIVSINTFCAVPTPMKFNVKEWIWYDRVDVNSKPFHTQCIRVLCEQKDRQYHQRGCEQKLRERLNATMLCMIPQWERRLGIPGPPYYPNELAGIPLVCNGSTLGLSTQVKTRGTQDYRTYPQDIYFTLTVVRILPWLIQQIKDNTPPIIPFYIEDQDLKRSDIPDPPRAPTPDWGQSEFFRLPTDKNPFPSPIAPRSGGSRTFIEVRYSFPLFFLHLTIQTNA